MFYFYNPRTSSCSKLGVHIISALLPKAMRTQRTMSLTLDLEKKNERKKIITVIDATKKTVRLNINQHINTFRSNLGFVTKIHVARFIPNGNITTFQILLAISIQRLISTTAENRIGSTCKENQFTFPSSGNMILTVF